MSHFWTKLLEYDDAEPMDDIYWAAVDPKGNGPRLVFQRVDDRPVEKSPVHLDLHVDDLDGAAATVTAMGGTRIDQAPINEAGSTWMRFEDPEGNVFCLVLARSNS